MNKEEQIEQLEKERHELLEKYHNIEAKITKLKIENYNYEGKYIFIENYGYMYVTWQHYEEKSIYGDKRMFFQGFTFKASITDYRDDFYIRANSLDEWYIPIDAFQRYVRDNKIKEVTKEEFINEFEKHYTNFHKEYKNMLDCCEKQYDEKINDQNG
jgi:hypothetical protein